MNKQLKELLLKTLSIPESLRLKIHRHFIMPHLVKAAGDKRIYQSRENFSRIRDATLGYISSCKTGKEGRGRYAYKAGGPPLVYASCYAALTLHLYGELESLSPSERGEWINYLQEYQCEDGLFRDPMIDVPLAEQADWWGWRHMTLHAIMAISALGGIARRPFRMLDQFHRGGAISEWLESRDWRRDPASTSNEVQNYGALMQYARDFQGELWCEGALEELFKWLDRHQDPVTGLWGEKHDTPWSLSLGVQTGYHLWLLYFYEMRRIQYVDRIIDSCLKTQNRLGGFGVPLNSSACEDIDSIDPLVRFYGLIDYRREEIRSALEKALFWIMVNSNSDGGWVFRRGESFFYGHELMESKRNESGMFPTWFRTLSLAYLGQILSYEQDVKYRWRFFRCPGLQFWIEKSKEME